MPEDIDDFVEFGALSDDNSWITEDTLTPPLPKDETIHKLNNGSQGFSTEGIEERIDGCLEERKDRLKESAQNAERCELDDIRDRLNWVYSQINKDKIHDRLDILDL
jgi:hypothetical protein